MRLNKFLAKSGITSRRGADLLIKSGRVRVNNQVVQKLGTKIDEEKDEIEVDGKKVKPAENLIYILLNKPSGYLTTLKDNFRRPVVTDLIREVKTKVFPVGRLDLNTTGVLLLTNDGELTYRLTHPKFEIEKVYEVIVKGRMGDIEVQKIIQGVRLEDQTIAQGKAKILRKEKNQTLLELSLKEGKKREVKRICKALGFEVVKLCRIKFAGLGVGKLKSGEWRYLKPEEVKRLKAKVGYS